MMTNMVAKVMTMAIVVIVSNVNFITIEQVNFVFY